MNKNLQAKSEQNEQNEQYDQFNNKIHEQIMNNNNEQIKIKNEQINKIYEQKLNDYNEQNNFIERRRQFLLKSKMLDEDRKKLEFLVYFKEQKEQREKHVNCEIVEFPFKLEHGHLGKCVKDETGKHYIIDNISLIGKEFRDIMNPILGSCSVTYENEFWGIDRLFQTPCNHIVNRENLMPKDMWNDNYCIKNFIKDEDYLNRYFRLISLAKCKQCFNNKLYNEPQFLINKRGEAQVGENYMKVLADRLTENMVNTGAVEVVRDMRDTLSNFNVAFSKINPIIDEVYYDAKSTFINVNETINNKLDPLLEQMTNFTTLLTKFVTKTADFCNYGYFAILFYNNMSIAINDKIPKVNRILSFLTVLIELFKILVPNATFDVNAQVNKVYELFCDNITSLMKEIPEKYLKFKNYISENCTKTSNFVKQHYNSFINNDTLERAEFQPIEEQINFAESQSETLDFISSMFAGLFLPAPLIDMIKKAQMFTKVKIFDALPSSTTIMTFLYEIIKNILIYMGVKEELFNRLELALPFTQGYNLVQTVKEILLKFDKKPNCIYNAEDREEVFSVYERFELFFKTFENNNNVPKITQIIRGKFSDLYRACKARENNSRQEPLGIILEGPAGTGKSSLQKLLINRLSQTNTIYHHNKYKGDHDWFDSYNNEDVMNMEDIGSTGLHEFSTLVKLIGTSKCPLECAAVEKKGTKEFTSLMIIGTSNKFKNINPSNSDGIADVHALWRRFILLDLDDIIFDDGVYKGQIAVKIFNYKARTAETQVWEPYIVDNKPFTFNPDQIIDGEDGLTIFFNKVVKPELINRNRYYKCGLEKANNKPLMRLTEAVSQSGNIITCKECNKTFPDIGLFRPNEKENFVCYTCSNKDKMIVCTHCKGNFIRENMEPRETEFTCMLCLDKIGEKNFSIKDFILDHYNKITDTLDVSLRTLILSVASIYSAYPFPMVLGTLLLTMTSHFLFNYLSNFLNQNRRFRNIWQEVLKQTQIPEKYMRNKYTDLYKNNPEVVTEVILNERLQGIVDMYFAENNRILHYKSGRNKKEDLMSALSQSTFLNDYLNGIDGIEKPESHILNTFKRNMVELNIINYDAKGNAKIEQCLGIMLGGKSHKCVTVNHCVDMSLKTGETFYLSVFTERRNCIMDNTIATIISRDNVNDRIMFEFDKYSINLFPKLSNIKPNNKENFYLIAPNKIIPLPKLRKLDFKLQYGNLGGRVDGFLDHEDWSYNYQCPGLCGALIVSEDGAIVGQHVACYEGQMGLAKYSNWFNYLNKIVIEDVVVPNIKNVEESSVIMLDEKVYSNPISKTKYVKSMFESEEFPATRAPANLNVYGYRTVQEMAKPQFVKTQALNKIAMEFASDYLDTIICEYGVLTEEEIVGGSATVEPINKDTSCGRGFPGKKDDYLDFVNKCYKLYFKKTMEEAQKYIECDGFDPNKFVFTETLKDELRDIEKVDKPRVFKASPLDFTCLVRKYLGDFIAKMIPNKFKHGIMVGINPLSSDWKKLFDTLISLNEKGYDGDWGKWDKGMLTQVQECVKRCLAKKSKHPQIINKIVTHIMNCPTICLDWKYIATHGLPSGCAITAYFNSLVNKFYGAYVFYLLFVENEGKEPTINQYIRNVCQVVFGDDQVTTSKYKWMNGKNHERIALEMGLDFTPASKGKWTEENSLQPILTNIYGQTGCSFLKRYFTYHSKLNTIVGPLMLNSVLSSPNYVSDDFRNHELTYIKLENAQRELFLWENIYDRKIQAITKQGYPMLGEDYLIKLYKKDDGSYSNFLELQSNEICSCTKCQYHLKGSIESKKEDLIKVQCTCTKCKIHVNEIHNKVQMYLKNGEKYLSTLSIGLQKTVKVKTKDLCEIIYKQHNK